MRARQAERRARRAERLAELGSMTSGLAHEIKNPLSTILLNGQLLAEGIADSQIEESERDRLLRRLDSLTREVERLRGILTDFLQFAGRMQLDPAPVDVVGVVEELGDFFLPQCEQAGVVMRVQVPDEKVMVELDQGLFKQALLNLMINATQSMAAMPDDNGSGRELRLRVKGGEPVRVHVIDTGPGIEADRLERIFHPYVSGHSGGSGLGLPTTRRIIEEHGGRIAAHSEVGRGSDFVIELPTGRSAARRLS